MKGFSEDKNQINKLRRQKEIRDYIMDTTEPTGSKLYFITVDNKTLDFVIE